MGWGLRLAFSCLAHVPANLYEGVVMMATVMLAVRRLQHEIGDTVVCPIAVQMVDHIARRDRSMRVLPYHAVLKRPSPLSLDHLDLDVAIVVAFGPKRLPCWHAAMIAPVATA
jgi:hypothetical protein